MRPLLLVYVASGVRIVRPYQRGVVEQLGKYKATVDPGLQLIIPIIQTVRLVDMREQVIDVPPQEVITSDNVVGSVDAVIYYEPTDPQHGRDRPRARLRRRSPHRRDLAAGRHAASRSGHARVPNCV